MKIIVSKKNVYGNELIYPICDKAKLFALISDKVTLSPRVITLIKKLGYQPTPKKEDTQLLETPGKSRCPSGNHKNTEGTLAPPPMFLCEAATV